MPRAPRPVLFAVFTVTGFAALSLQVVWQRVISLHSGVDLVSFTTVIAAFLAGLGAGSLLGGVLADRLGPGRSARAFAVAAIAAGLFSWTSIWWFYDVYERLAPSLTSVGAKFAVNAAILLVPTTLMGLSTPLVARAAAGREAPGPLVGRLYAANTFGAAAGAASTGWYLQGALGFTATARLAGTLQILAGVAVLALVRVPAVAEAGGTEPSAVASGPSSEPAITADGEPEIDGAVWPWFVAYGVTGAVALGFETVFFRVIDTIMRSNSYSFGHVLSMYLLLYAVGAAAGSAILRRRRLAPDRWFLWLQFAVGVAALGGVIVLVKGAPRSPWAEGIRSYFGGEGFSVGFTAVDGSAHHEILQVFGLAPLVVMAVPVLLMGASYPFVQALVATRPGSLGRRTGTLLAANIVGNVVGTLVTGFVLVDRLGTSGTYRVLATVLLGAGLAAAWRSGGTVLRRGALAGAAVVVLLLGLRTFPDNQLLYSSLHGVDQAGITLAEDRSCATALRHIDATSRELTVNGAAQNLYPFDDFHVLVGMTPAIAHPGPTHAMALGLGIGATPYGLAADPRIEAIDTVELCGGELDLLRDLGAGGAPELRELFGDPRQSFVVGDGRDHLLRAPEQSYDVVVVDTLRSHAAFSGSLYSEEFYALIRSRLRPGGILAQWDASPRVLDTVTREFPYVVRLSVGTYYGSAFFLASDRPIEWNREALEARVAASRPQSAGVQQFFHEAVPACIRAGDRSALPSPPAGGTNTDLRPLDEYFLNNAIPAPPQLGTC